MDFLENFLYYFVDNGIEIIEIVIVFITFFGMRADLTRKNLLLSFITLVLLSFLSVLEKQTYIFVILYILFFIMEIYILYNEFINWLYRRLPLFYEYGILPNNYLM